MSRKLRFVIDKKNSGIMLKEFMRRELGFSLHQISRIKYRSNGLVINGTCVFVNAWLKEGDIVELSLADEKEDLLADWVPAPEGPLDPEKILYEDGDLLAADKPSGLVCHPSHGHYAQTLANEAASYLKAKGENCSLHIVGRLDMETSGIVLFAKNPETAAFLSKGRMSGSLRKLYLAAVHGSFDVLSGTVDLPLRRENPSYMKMVAAQDGMSAVTHYHVLGEKDGRSLLALQLEEGRTHQIRVHMSQIGHPLLGDPLYAEPGIQTADGADRASLCLHAFREELIHPFTDEKLLLEAPLPAWTEEFLPAESEGEKRTAFFRGERVFGIE